MSKSERPPTVLEYDFENSVGYWLISAQQTYVRAFQQAITDYGVTFRQAQVLGTLAQHGPLSQKDIAERLLIEPPNLVGVLDRMAEAGLIERCECPDDRRKKIIRPLPASKKLWKKVAACGREIRERAVEGMSAAEQAALRDSLLRIQQNLGALEPVG